MLAVKEFGVDGDKLEQYLAIEHLYEEANDGSDVEKLMSEVNELLAAGKVAEAQELFNSTIDAGIVEESFDEKSAKELEDSLFASAVDKDTAKPITNQISVEFVQNVTESDKDDSVYKQRYDMRINEVDYVALVNAEDQKVKWIGDKPEDADYIAKEFLFGDIYSSVE